MYAALDKPNEPAKLCVHLVARCFDAVYFTGSLLKRLIIQDHSIVA